MRYKVFNSYGGFSLKNGGTELNYEDIENKLVQTLDEQTGYIRVVGTTNIHEHGYSANENIYKLITLNYNVVKISLMN